MPAKLYVVPASHPCEAVAKALEIKGISYDRVYLVPAAHKALQKARFGTSTVPGVVFDDGEKVIGSRAIMRALERRVPEPPLLPASDSAGTAEEWGDQVLQPLTRRLVWWALTRNHAAQVSYLGDAKLFPPTPAFMARLAARPVAWAERKFNSVTEAAVKADMDHLPSHLDRIDGWIAEGVIGGEAPNAADLQIASSLRLLLTLGDVQPQIDARPAGELARRLFPDYPGHVPAGALPPTREP